MKSNTAYCVFLAVTLIFWDVLIFPLIMLRGLPKSNPISLLFVIIYLIILAANTDYFMYTLRKTRKNYKNILYTADNMDRTDYEDICLNVTSGAAFGGFYCGDDFLYSPFGILCKWEDIWKINVELCSYKSAVIRITLSSSEVTEGAMFRRKDIIALSDSLDDFEQYVKGKGTAINIEYVNSVNSIFREEN